jgi:hypothetical protein
VHADLKAAVSEYPSVVPPHPLGERVREAVDRLQAEHPRLSGLLTAALDALSDLGVQRGWRPEGNRGGETATFPRY